MLSAWISPFHVEHRYARNMSDPAARRKLGKGLTGMLGTPIAVPSPIEIAKPANLDRDPTSVAMALVHPNPNQPRTIFDDKSLAELADSIKQHGIIQPILVRRKSDDTYEIIAGERRWRAAQVAGLDSIPVLVRNVSDQESAEWALVENLQREDLGPMERAHAFSRLGKEFGLSHAQIAERVGMDRSTVANITRLIELEPEIQELLNSDRISFGHGRALLAAPSGPGRIALARDAASGEWSVRRLERAASALAQTKRPRAEKQSPQVAGDHASDAVRLDLERRLGEFLNTRVSIRTDGRGETGRVVVEFYTSAQFEGLLERIGFR